MHYFYNIFQSGFTEHRRHYFVARTLLKWKSNVLAVLRNKQGHLNLLEHSTNTLFFR